MESPPPQPLPSKQQHTRLYQAVPASEADFGDDSEVSTGMTLFRPQHRYESPGRSVASVTAAAGGIPQSQSRTHGHSQQHHPPTPLRRSQTPPEDESEHSSNHDDGNDDETNSLVADVVVRSPSRNNHKNNSSGIFRPKTTAYADDQQQHSEEPTIVASRSREELIRASAASPTGPGGGARTPATSPSVTAAVGTSRCTTPLHVTGGSTTASLGSSSRPGERGRSNVVVVVSPSRSLSFDLDWDEDEDEINLRRYHYLDLSAGVVTPRDVPLSAEFQGHTWVDQLWYVLHQSWTVGRRHWTTLRQSARQRRAARLLTMPSESIRYKLRASLLSTFCDATDVGIVVTAVVLTLWMLLGTTTAMGQYVGYWMSGGILFAIRVTARRCYETCSRAASSSSSRQQQQQRRRLGSRQHLRSVDEDAAAASADSSLERNLGWNKIPNSDSHPSQNTIVELPPSPV